MLEEEEFSEKELVKIYVLNLVDTNKEKDIHLADFLVDKKMAVYDKLDSEKLVVPLKEAVTKDAAAEPLRRLRLLMCLDCCCCCWVSVVVAAAAVIVLAIALGYCEIEIGLVTF